MGYDDYPWIEFGGPGPAGAERKAEDRRKLRESCHPAGNLQVSCAFIRDAEFEHLLLSRRASDNPWGPGLWETPGGKVDRGESVEEACKREILEELGVDIKLEAKVVTLFNIPIPPANRKSGDPAERFDITAFLGTIDHNDRDPAPLESDMLQWWRISDIEKADPSLFVTAQPGLFPALMLYRKEANASVSRSG